MKNHNQIRRRTGRLHVLVALSPEESFKMNVVIVLGIALLLVVQALFINHVNTLDYRLTDFKRDGVRLTERNGELEARISESQTLGSIEERAIELGMVAVSDYTFLTSVDTSFAKR